MSGSFQRLGRLWMVSRYTSRNSSGGCLNLVRVNTCGSQSLAPRNYSAVTQMRLFSGTPAPSKIDRSQDDRIQFFTHPEVQDLLSELTGRDLKRIFRKRKVGQKLREPKYSFMTEAQVEEARKEAELKADQLLQMPPVLRPRKPIDEVLSFDPHIQGEEKYTLIFTDITLNIRDRDRIVVARDPDGTLRQATWAERDKVNAIYFPVPHRDFVTPKMFTDSTALQQILNRATEKDNTYEFVLDRACLQFEPDDPLYISVVENTYETVDRCGHYDLLKSTRHFGPMVFYLARMRKMDGLLLHSIKQRRVTTDGVKLIALFQLMFPECQSKSTDANISDIEKVRAYIKVDAVRKDELLLALNAYEEEENKKNEYEEGLKLQHGVQ